MNTYTARQRKNDLLAVEVFMCSVGERSLLLTGVDRSFPLVVMLTIWKCYFQRLLFLLNSGFVLFK